MAPESYSAPWAWPNSWLPEEALAWCPVPEIRGEDVWAGWNVASPQGPAARHRARLTVLASGGRVTTAAIASKVSVEVFSFFGV